jgi:putative colanic acid biosynthesis UDP-glucose lipid carrier transferase
MTDIAHEMNWNVHAELANKAGTVYRAPARTPGDCLRNSKVKRLTDIMGAGLGLLILLPFLALVALLVVLESPGPVFFRQRRSGKDGKVFAIYKFRTMRVMEDGLEIVQARRGDQRVTRIGRFLRRSSIDELPQLINVLKGEMSLVGPRPHALAHDIYYSGMVPNYNLRFQAKPGITGLAQVEGLRGEVRDTDHMQARITRDLAYIADWSWTMDARILLLTVTSAPFHTAAY